MEVRPLTKDLRSSVTPNFWRSCSEGEGSAAAAGEGAATAMAEMLSERDLI